MIRSCEDCGKDFKTSRHNVRWCEECSIIRDYNPPKNKEEFLERADKVELKAALAIQNALRQRIRSVSAALRSELEFYDKVIELHQKGPEVVEWPVNHGESK